MRGPRRDPRTPVRSVALGTLEAHLYETAEGQRWEVTGPGNGRLVVYPHEVSRLALFADLMKLEAASWAHEKAGPGDLEGVA